jgi:hypothetical protein
MQTYKEKVAILASVDSLEDLLIKVPEVDKLLGLQCAKQWSDRVFNIDATLSVKPKTITRTITTPVPVSSEWAIQHIVKSVYLATKPFATMNLSDVSETIFKLGLVFETQSEAQAAHDALLESMK